MIKIDFEFDSPIGVFRDALWFPEDHGMTDAEIEAMKQQRFDAWWAAVNPTQDIKNTISTTNPVEL